MDFLRRYGSKVQRLRYKRPNGVQPPAGSDNRGGGGPGGGMGGIQGNQMHFSPPPPQAPRPVVADEMMLMQLVSMVIPEPKARQALVAVKNSSGIQRPLSLSLSLSLLLLLLLLLLLVLSVCPQLTLRCELLLSRRRHDALLHCDEPGVRGDHACYRWRRRVLRKWRGCKQHHEC
jgi:hypothetical protein